MILLSVGTQLPFERLVTAVDQWAKDHPDINVVAQIGPSRYKPTAMHSMAFIDPSEFRVLQAQCSLMISHAGIGSIINALELAKPIIVLPRDHTRGEHRNGHQISTAERFKDIAGVYPARDEQHLIELLNRAHTLSPGAVPAPYAPPEFIDQLKDYIQAATPKPLWRLLLDALRKTPSP